MMGQFVAGWSYFWSALFTLPFVSLLGFAFAFGLVSVSILTLLIGPIVNWVIRRIGGRW